MVCVLHADAEGFVVAEATLVTVINLDAQINLDSLIIWSILNNVLSQKYDYLY